MDLGRSLLEAAREGNTERVYEFMSKGAPFTTDWLGTSPLHLAAKNNHVETCRVLLRGGLNKDSKTKVDRTPLHFAVFEGHTEVVKLMLANKCNPNAQDMLKMSPLHWAIEKGSLEIVDLLLQYGADPNIKSKFGKTPISLAAEKQNVALLKRLVDPTKASTSIQQTDVASKKLGDDIKVQTTNQEDDIIIEDIIDSDADDDLIEEDNNSTIGDAFMQMPDTESSATTKAGIELLKEHGIQLMKVDDSGSVIQSALESGRRLILSEAGKFILKNAINHNLFPTPDTARVALTRPKLNILQRRPVKKVVQLSSNNQNSIFVPAKTSPSRQTKRERSTESISTPPTPLPQPKQQKMSQKFPEFGKLPHSTTVTVQDRRSTSQATKTVDEVIDLDEVLPTINGTDNTETGDVTKLSELDKQVQELRKETGDLRKQLEISQKQNQDYQRRLEKLEAIILSFHRASQQQQQLLGGRSHSVT